MRSYAVGFPDTSAFCSHCLASCLFALTRWKCSICIKWSHLELHLCHFPPPETTDIRWCTRNVESLCNISKCYREKKNELASRRTKGKRISHSAIASLTIRIINAVPVPLIVCIIFISRMKNWLSLYPSLRIINFFQTHLDFDLAFWLRMVMIIYSLTFYFPVTCAGSYKRLKASKHSF